MKDLRIGVIGTGAIGREHIIRITERLMFGEVVAVYDINEEGAKAAAELCGARVEKSEEAVVNAPDVDAIIVTTWEAAHAKGVLLGIQAGKPVFVEKPLATTVEECKQIMEAEIATGRHLVQVGFMRRYDNGFKQVKEIIDSTEVGAPLMIHNRVRTQTVPESYDTPLAVTGTVIHEIDCMHWLLGENYVSCQVIYPKATSKRFEHLQDPQIMIMTTESGVVIDTECFVNSQYGYDIQCEVVCEDGVVHLPDASFPTVRKNAMKTVEIETDWKRRFIQAYDDEVQDWIISVQKGEINGPNAWDGYFATLVADAMLKAQETKEITPIELGEQPEFYKR